MIAKIDQEIENKKNLADDCFPPSDNDDEEEDDSCDDDNGFFKIYILGFGTTLTRILERFYATRQLP